MAANRAHWCKSNISIPEFNSKHLSGFFKFKLWGDKSSDYIGIYQFQRQQEKALIEPLTWNSARSG